MRQILSVALLLFAATLPVVADHHPLLDDEEHQWILSLTEPLVVATEVGYHPYNFVDEDGDLSGVAGDYMRLMGERLGIEYEVRVYQTFAEVLEAAKNREVDIVPLLVAAPERRVYLDFTQAAYETQDRILMRTDTQGVMTLDDLDGMTLGIIAGYAIQAELEAEYPAINLKLFETEIEGLLGLSLGQVDAYIAEVGTSSYYIQQEAITNIRVAGVVEGDDAQAFGTRSDWPILNRVIGKGLATISPEEHDEIMRRWVGIEGVGADQLRRFWPIAAVVLGVLIAVFFWSLSLRRLVAKRTAELRQQLEERRKLEATKERLAVAVEQSAEYVLVVDKDGNIEYANWAFIEASGIATVKGRRLESLAINSSVEVLADCLALVGRDGPWRGNIGLAQGTDGAMKVAMTIAPIFDADGNLDGYVATGRDVTHEEQLESRLRQSDKLSSLGTLAGGIAHDFNNLLMPIFGYAEMLSKEGDVRVAQYVDGIIEASERARDLVRQILIFGRGGGGKLEPLDVCAEIIDSKPLLDSLLPAKVELRFNLSGCSAVMCDESQLQQIVVNLCRNAGDAMKGDGGVIKIDLEELTLPDRHVMAPPDLAAGPYNVLKVTDDGEGMDADTLARIFDPYFTDKQPGDGTGLGLAIVHGIVTSHGGAIQVESTPNTGTSVIIYLPSVDREPVRRTIEPKREVQDGGGKNVLVLDDDKSVLATVDKMLQTLGYTVNAWSDPAAALEAFRDGPDTFDVIVADFKMPQMTGQEFAEQVRAIRADIPVVIMSGNPEGLEGSGFDYVTKPLSLQELATAVSDSLG